MSRSCPSGFARAISSPFEDIRLIALLLAQAFRRVLDPTELSIATGLVVFQSTFKSQTVIGVVLIRHIVSIANVVGQVRAKRSALRAIALLLHKNARAAQEAIIP